MRFLALDASTTAVGWAVFEDGKYCESGVFVPPSNQPWWIRVRRIGVWLDEVLDRFYGPVAYEIATGNKHNMRTNRLLGAVEFEVRCVVAQWLTRQFVTITASQVRATGCHKKALDVAAQIKGAALDTKHPGDEADAIGVGLAAWGKIKEAQWTEQS